jgi:ubiquinol-cytochrome c reductase cytochrome b subunit
MAKYKVSLIVFVIAFVWLGVLGVQSSTELRTLTAQVLTLLYFGFFLFMPVYSRPEKKVSFSLLTGTFLALAVVLGVVYYWVGLGTLPMLAIIPAAIVVLAFTVYFLIIPGFIKAEATKPVPERVTK